MRQSAMRAEAIAGLQRAQGFDLAIVGGGATGLAIAREAALRGFSTALIERGDFACGTSSRSTKLLHGGVRYLAQGHLGLVRQSLRERKALMQLAPELSSPLQFILPTNGLIEQLFKGLGLVAYDWLAGPRSLGATRLVSASTARMLAPALRDEALSGAVSYFDAQFDDAGLAIELAHQAAGAGALLSNYIAADHLIKSHDRVSGIHARDEETGSTFDIMARCVINATGVWVDSLRDGRAPLVQPSQGTHIVVDAEFSPGEQAILIPDTSDGRIVFIIPWMGKRIIGTTDVAVGSSDSRALPEPLPSSGEIDLLLTEAARVLRKAPVRSDIRSAWSGLRPLVRPSRAADNHDTASLSREHWTGIDQPGLISITGGKWTTCLAMARDAMAAATKAGFLSGPGRTRVPNSGPAPVHRGPATAPIGGTIPSAEQVRWLARHAWVRRVEDLLGRRSRLMYLDLRAAIAAAPLLADVLSEETGVDPGLEAFQDIAHAWLVAIERRSVTEASS